MNFHDGRLLVFTKAPIQGQVKTRLIPAIGSNAARVLHEKLVTNTIRIAYESGIAPIELWCYPETNNSFLKKIANQYSATLHQQQGCDLGERMYNAIDSDCMRSDWTIIIGTDCPVFTSLHLIEAVSKLKQGADAVITPANDGGYVLIGLRHNNPNVFTDISWGTNVVFIQTLQRLRSLAWNWHQMETLWDVDRPEDLSKLSKYPDFS